MIKDSNSANSVFIQSTFLVVIPAFHSAAIEAIGILANLRHARAVHGGQPFDP